MTSSTNVRRETVNGLKNISDAKLFSRFVAFIVDLAIMAFTFFSLLLFTQNVVCKNSPYVKSAQDEFYGYNIDSGLFKWNEQNNALVPQEYESYKEYQDLFANYYLTYLTSECPEKYRVSYVVEDVDLSVYWFNVHVLGQEDILNKYPDDIAKLDQLVTSKGPDLFTYQLDADNNKLVHNFALPKCLNNDPSAKVSEDDNKVLRMYFFIADADNKDNETSYYHVALKDLSARKFVSNAYDNWYNHYYKMPIIFCFAFAALSFFFVIPMIFKNGETLGKLMFHLGLCNKLGYKYHRIQLIPRFFVTVSIVVILYLLFDFSIISLGIFTFYTLASYTLSIFTKNHKAIHDFISGTIVYDKVHSEVFDDATEEARIQAEIQKVKPIDLKPDIRKDDDSLLYVNENFENQTKDENNKEG